MKNKFINFCILLTVIFGVISCSNEKKESVEQNTIVTSMAPLKWLVSEIAGNNFSVISILNENVSHETFEPSLDDLKKLEKSKIYFHYDMFEFEERLEEFVEGKNISSSVLENIDKNLLLEDKYHNDSLHHEHDDHEKEEHHHDHGSSGRDPHVWFSMAITKEVAKNVYDKLCEVYPEHKEEFTNNYSSFIEKVNSFESLAKEKLDKLDSTSFIIYHPALEYFLKGSKVKEIAIEVEGKEASAKEIQEIIEEAKEHNVKTIYVQPQFSKDMASEIKKEINAEIVEFNIDKENVIENLTQFLNDLK